MKAQSIVLLVLFCGLIGCSGGDGKVLVSGTVTWNGTPLDKGKILFLEPGESSEAADIVNGEFQIRTSPGDKKVGITAFKEVPVSGGRPGEVRDHQILPAIYNEQSTLITTIVDGSDALAFKLEGTEVEVPKDAGEFQERPAESDSGRSRDSRSTENRRPGR